MIVTKAILIEIGLEVFRRYGVIDAIDTTLNQRPKALNCVYMGETSSIVPFAMDNPSVGVSELLNEVVAGKLISIDDVGYVSRHLLPDDSQITSLSTNRGRFGARHTLRVGWEENKPYRIRLKAL